MRSITRIGRNSVLAVAAMALAATAGIAVVTPTPAQARVFIGFGVAPWWGFGPYWYPPPIVYAPPAYVPPPSYAVPAASGTWYYCDDPAGYYPYVRSCDAPWRPVAAQPRQ